MAELSLAEVSCPICGNQERLKAEDLFHCRSCGLQAKRSPDGLYSTDIEKNQVGYPEDGSANTLEIEDSSFWFAHRQLVISAFINRYFTNGFCLDIGGGNGFETRKLQNIFKIATLVEPSYQGCRAANQRGVKNIIQGTLDSLALMPNQISVACFFDVLEHLDHPHEILKQTFKILKPDGRIYITVPAFEFLWSNEDFYAEHKRRYTKQSLSKELLSAGFEIEFSSYYFSILLLPIFLFRTLPSRLGRRNSNEMNKNEHKADGFIQRFIIYMLKIERQLLERGWRLPFGSSIVCVARKAKVN